MDNIILFHNIVSNKQIILIDPSEGVYVIPVVEPGVPVTGHQVYDGLARGIWKKSL